MSADPASAESWMRRSDAQPDGVNRAVEPRIALNRAWTLAAGDQLTRATEQAQAAASLARAFGQPVTEAIACYDVARLGQPRLVQQRLTELAATVDGALVPAFAHAATALGTGDGSALDEAAIVFNDLGLVLYAAEVASAASQAHRHAGRPGRAWGAHERMGRLRAACEGARTPLLADHGLSSTLSRREREIALLAASGLPSRAIAIGLSLSVRTVDNHLAHAYAKLGINNRDGLAVLLNPSATRLARSSCSVPIGS